jgi:hypothetical protein
MFHNQNLPTENQWLDPHEVDNFIFGEQISLNIDFSYVPLPYRWRRELLKDFLGKDRELDHNKSSVRERPYFTTDFTKLANITSNDIFSRRDQSRFRQ